MPKPFVHVELNTTNIAAAKSFYGALFGWNLQPMEVMGAGWLSIVVDPTGATLGLWKGTGR